MTTRRALLAGAAGAFGAVGLGSISPTRASAEPVGSAGRPDAGIAGWERLPDLPPNRTDWAEEIPVGEAYWRQLGLAGPVAGAHGDHLIVAGGANFPEPGRTAGRDPVLGKVYWNDAFVLRRSGEAYTWLDLPLTLPDAVAYAACLSTPRGVLVIGGEGFRGGPNGAARATMEKFADVYLLRFDPVAEALVRDDLPSLPRPLSYGAAAMVGTTVYVAEGESFCALDLADPESGWRTLPTWPGGPRTVAVAASDGRRFHLISGRDRQSDGSWTLHTDAYSFDPGDGSWSRLADLPRCVMAGVGVGDRRGITVYAGDGDVERWDLIQEHTAAGNVDVVAWLQDHHTGFNGDVLRYDLRTGRWSTVDRFPGAAQVTTPAVEWDGDLIIASGEVRPGVRTPVIWRVRR